MTVEGPRSRGEHAVVLTGAPGALPAPTRATVRAPADLARRLTWLMLVRTVAVTVVLGLTLWLLATAETRSTALVVTLSGLIAVTYILTIVYAVLLRRQVAAARLVWPQLIGDVAIAGLLLYCTGGATSAYAFFFALSLVSAGALLYQRGVLVIGGMSIALITLVSIAAWRSWLPLPMVPQARPWEQSSVDFIRSLGINLAAISAVGVLAYAFGEQLQRTSQSLASERRVVADLVTLHEDILRSLSSGLITIDRDGNLLTANQVASEVFARPTTAMVGRPLAEVCPPLAARLAGLGADATVQRGDLTFQRAGRQSVLGISVSPLRDVQDQAIGRVINFTDLTALRAMETQVRRAERMATVGQLAAGIAHEIRNPLASISGSVELLRTSPQASDDDRALMAIVTREMERLDGLISDLLDYTNPRPRQPVRFDLVALVDETVQVFRQDPILATLGAEVAIAASEAVLEVEADPAQLRQVLWNLLRNAADAVAKAGDAAPGRIEVAVGRDGGQVRVDVTDTGPGVPVDALPHIFDPFFTTKRTGSGLGLAVCQALITDHGGSLDVSNQAQGGARFTVRLPG
ncbi:MAG: PAS domain-containing protein [Kofleriaceae bacterium]|jgi:two-component system sensor histidine kinase PilS (NtrC family)|nr:PAS domain-containing protein [Kofleriaceae bacterium]